MATLAGLLDGADEAAALVVTEGGAKMSRALMRADVGAVAAWLARAGVQRGHVVSLCFKNTV